MTTISLRRLADGLIIVESQIYDANCDSIFRKLNLALDTAASLTTIRSDVLCSLNYDIFNPINTLNIITGNGYMDMGCIKLSMLTVFGCSFKNVRVGIIELTKEEYIDGVLGQNILSMFDYTVRNSNNTMEIERIKNQETTITP